MRSTHRLRRAALGILLLIMAAVFIVTNPDNHSYQEAYVPETVDTQHDESLPGQRALSLLDELETKGRAPKTGYSRSMFGSGWASRSGCDTRNLILYRDLEAVVVDDKCRVMSGTLLDPYTGRLIKFKRGQDTSSLVQVDHVVALSDAWQKGAQRLSSKQRVELSNDPLELLAVEGAANQQKGDGDAATWLPSNKSFRCQYVARQVAVKQKYNLWVTQAERDAMKRVLDRCPGQLIPVAKTPSKPVL